MQIFNDSMNHLKGPHWVSNDLVDAFSSVTVEPGVIIATCDVSSYMFVNLEMTTEENIIYKNMDIIESQNPRLILFPILYGNHRVLYVLDFQKKVSYELNPYGPKKTNSERSHNSFQRYLLESRKRCINVINKVDWTFTESTDRYSHDLYK